VTHGAVSRAVRNLEDLFGAQLMIRTSRSMRLTPIGASFATEIRDVLEHLAAATSAATGQSSGIASVSTIDSFASRWLMPKRDLVYSSSGRSRRASWTTPVPNTLSGAFVCVDEEQEPR